MTTLSSNLMMLLVLIMAARMDVFTIEMILVQVDYIGALHQGLSLSNARNQQQQQQQHQQQQQQQQQHQQQQLKPLQHM